MKRMKLFVLALLLSGGSFAFGDEKFVNLGPQVSAMSIQGSEFVRESSGRDVLFTAERGSPGHLLSFDANTGKPIMDKAFPNADGAWEVALSSDGWLYSTGGNGHLYRHKPGTTKIEDLGQVLGQRVIWDVTAGPNGEIYAGTYPSGLVARYRPGEGFTDVGRGPIVPGENYVRAVVYNPANGHVFVGVGSHAHLIDLDPKTGEKHELLKDKTAGQEAVYSLQIIPDAKSGDRLLAWVTNRGKTLVYNLRTQKVEREVPTSDVKAVKKSPTSEDVYYSDGSSMLSFNLDHPDQPPRKLLECGVINATQWQDGDHLWLLCRAGKLIHYDVQTGQATEKKLHMPPQSIPIQSIALGPDGKMWMGGFLAGGTAEFDPQTHKSIEYRGMSQIERIGVLGDEMYFGVYPHGRFYRFDPSKPWGQDNPRKFGQIAGQSRPIAMLGVPELDRVFIGEVPEYGFLGGHFLQYDPKANKLYDYGVVVARQSPVSLAYADGLIVGGTSISGGLGIKPSEKDAKLFEWDPKTQKKTFEMVPVPSAIAITCLINGPDKNIWGVADGTLFIFDPVNRKIIRSKHLVDVNYDSKNIWRDAFLVVHPSGQIYSVISGHLLRIDPQTLAATVIRNQRGLELLAMDAQGRLYFHIGIDLWQYTP
ncbi:MAG TPA: hypothetical protein VGG19_08900 [Tepidisphaeraceae bacterium]|jgi:outer membrane protein assembly factor BamB